jgi:hypothetical protein
MNFQNSDYPESNFETGFPSGRANGYVVSPYDYRYKSYIVDKDTNYPYYQDDINSRVNSYKFRVSRNSRDSKNTGNHQQQYNPLNENAEMSAEYRKYVNDDSGAEPYWYRHTVPPTVNEIYRDTLRRIDANYTTPMH